MRASRHWQWQGVLFTCLKMDMEAFDLDYIEMLEQYQNMLGQLRRARRLLEDMDVFDTGSHAACRTAGNHYGKTDRTASLALRHAERQERYERLKAERERQKKAILIAIRDGENPDLLKALYWRKICGMKWNEVCERLEGRYSCAAIRQAASRYERRFRQVAENWEYAI